MKRSRHDKIIELIQNYDIETQEDLAARLREAGYQVTQATISRDIRQMRLTKIAGRNGKQKYFALPSEDGYLGDKYSRVLKEGFISMDAAMNILVIKTVSGMAMAVAAAVDDMKMSEIVGSIAGDDTIMSATRSPEDAKVVMEKIRTVIAQKS
jgi:transcriptional regulator of arginine metabolism